MGKIGVDKKENKGNKKPAAWKGTFLSGFRLLLKLKKYNFGIHRLF